MRGSPAWKIAAASAALCAALAMGAFLGTVALQRRALPAPDFELVLGPARVAAFVTTTPNCRTSSYSYQKGSICSGQSIFSPDEYFAIWAKLRTRRNGVAYERAQRLFIVRLGDR